MKGFLLMTATQECFLPPVLLSHLNIKHPDNKMDDTAKRSGLPTLGLLLWSLTLLSLDVFSQNRKIPF